MATKSSIKNWILVPLSLLVLYFVLETTCYFLICANILRPDFGSVLSRNFGASDRPYVKYDSLTGYRYTGNRPHLTNIHNGKIVYEHSMPVNNRGYCSVDDFEFKKSQGCKRWMVFGDSYTAGEITDTTWVDLYQKRFNKDSTEHYNFGLEGSGINNWHAIFFKEIIPNYEFDGIVLAVFGDLKSKSYDLARPVIIKHSFDNYSGLSFFDSLPINSDDFEQNYKNKLFYESSIYDSADIAKYKLHLLGSPKKTYRFSWTKPEFYFLHIIWDAIVYFQNINSFEKRFSSKYIDPKMLSGTYEGLLNYDELFGKQNMNRVAEMMDYCVKNKKSIRLISIPSYNVVARDPKHYHNNIYNKHLKLLAKQYGASFYDGYQLYDSIPIAARENYILYGDSHWNRKGIDLFLTMLP